MKNIFTLISFVGTVTSVNATIHIVTCQNGGSHFLPVTLDAIVGDTVHWTWVSGNHVVGPISASDIPAGAALFNAPINSNNLSFEYVVTVAGDYHYVCHPDDPHDEDAYIVVSDASAVQQANVLNNYFSVYPNPSNGKFHFAIGDKMVHENCKVEIWNMQGQVIYRWVLNDSNFLRDRRILDIDLRNETNGVYIIKFWIGDVMMASRIVAE